MILINIVREILGMIMIEIIFVYDMLGRYFTMFTERLNNEKVYQIVESLHMLLFRLFLFFNVHAPI